MRLQDCIVTVLFVIIMLYGYGLLSDAFAGHEIEAVAVGD